MALTYPRNNYLELPNYDVNPSFSLCLMKQRCSLRKIPAVTWLERKAGSSSHCQWSVCGGMPLDHSYRSGEAPERQISAGWKASLSPSMDWAASGGEFPIPMNVPSTVITTKASSVPTLLTPFRSQERGMQFHYHFTGGNNSLGGTSYWFPSDHTSGRWRTRAWAPPGWQPSLICLMAPDPAKCLTHSRCTDVLHRPMKLSLSLERNKARNLRYCSLLHLWSFLIKKYLNVDFCRPFLKIQGIRDALPNINGRNT